MVLSPENGEENEDPHPYWYARILGIYHANVRYIGSNHTVSREPQHMEFLFVRWFGRDPTPRPGWKAKHLIRLGFVPRNDETAFGFIDPAQVIRSIHLIRLGTHHQIHSTKVSYRTWHQGTRRRLAVILCSYVGHSF